MNPHAVEPNGSGTEDPERSHSPDLPSDPGELVKAMEAHRKYLLLVANQEMDKSLSPKGGASDLVQETFLEAHCDLDRFEGRSERELKNWLRKILIHNLSNFARRYRKSRKRQVSREVSLEAARASGGPGYDLAGSTPSPSRCAIRSEEEMVLESALDRLGERDRMILIWHNRDRLPWDEIGRRLNGSPGMARKAWLRAVERLRAQVGDAGPTSGSGFSGT